MTNNTLYQVAKLGKPHSLRGFQYINIDNFFRRFDLSNISMQVGNEELIVENFKTHLKDRNLTRKQDISKYLNQLQDGALSVSSAKNYAVEIKNCYVRRSLIKISDEIINQSLNPKIEIDPEDQISHAEELLFNLAERDKTQNGPQSFKSTLKSASQLIDEAYKRGKGLPGVDTGFSGLNRFLGGLNKSDLIVLAGRPSMGKTALATNIAFRASKATSQKNEPVLFFSLEMSAEQLAQRILAEQASIDSHRIRRGDIENEAHTDSHEGEMINSSNNSGLDLNGKKVSDAIESTINWLEENGKGLKTNYSNSSYNIHLEYRPSDKTNMFLSGGVNSGDGFFANSQGYGRTDGNEMWSQFRLQSGGLFAQIYTVVNDGGDDDSPTFLYNTGFISSC